MYGFSEQPQKPQLSSEVFLGLVGPSTPFPFSSHARGIPTPPVLVFTETKENSTQTFAFYNPMLAGGLLWRDSNLGRPYFTVAVVWSILCCKSSILEVHRYYTELVCRSLNNFRSPFPVETRLRHEFQPICEKKVWQTKNVRAMPDGVRIELTFLRFFSNVG